ncbi:nardilysin [Prorops nasuta]|uniref:nardilysin n=1 Tax=Prorops nasuta TaxID=863751 RepID=UPI0034CEE625
MSHVETMSSFIDKSVKEKINESNKDKNKFENIMQNHDTRILYLDEPVKSVNDKKEYRVIILHNDLRALLIADNSSEADIQKDSETLSESESEESIDGSEDEKSMGESEEEEESDGESIIKDSSHGRKEEKMAACSLCIGVGSFSDPPEIPGMAHFLEHMVFMGSEKFPQENDFDAYVQKCGGSDNASTECEQTTFYFEVQEKHLLPTLTRFAQFFISPLMKRDAISREREAVESEFQMALPSDTHRKQQLFSSFAQDNHPAGKFMWGNSITLKDNVKEDKLYEELHKFRKRHYSAHRMTVAIQARLPLDTLEKYVVECFSDVPTNGLPGDDFTKYKEAITFNTDKFRKIYKIRPVKDVCMIEITWNMPPLLDSYKSKPHQYVSWIIGHEGKGSLISYLRKKMWCLELYCGNNETGFEYNSMYSFLYLSLFLTDEGHNNLDKVLEAVYSYINMFRKAGPQKRIYDEICQIEETKFRFVDEEDPCDYVEELSESMHFYEPKDYITGSELYFEYNPEGIQACIDCLHPENMNIIISNRNYNDEEFNKVEPWFNTRYKIEDIPLESIKRWKTIEPLPDFHLPLPNIYLTNNFNLISLPDRVPDYPKKILENETCEIWYRPDPKFRMPECYMYFYLISPLTSQSARTYSMTELYTIIMKQMLVEELYPATVAELEQECLPRNRGLEIKLNGFNQKLPLLLQTISQYIADSPNLIKKDLFEVMKEQQLKSYYNKVVKPGQLAKEIRFCILIKEYSSALQRHTVLSEIQFEEFQTFVKQFVSSFFFLGLVQGNMTEEEILNNVQKCTEILNCKFAMPVLSITEIPKGIHEVKVKNINKTDVNSTVANYYQFCDNQTHDLVAVVDLILMIMQEPMFNQLRTKEQLGYNVFCTSNDTYGVSGYSMVINTQADKYTTEYANERMEIFLKSFEEKLATMSEEEFSENKEALIKLKKQALVQLKEEVDRNWKEIKTREFVFDRMEREVEAIERITIKKLKNFVHDNLLEGENIRKLSVHIIGASDKKREKIENEKEQKSLKLEYIVEAPTAGSKVQRILHIENIDFPIKRIACE